MEPNQSSTTHLVLASQLFSISPRVHMEMAAGTVALHGTSRSQSRFMSTAVSRLKDLLLLTVWIRRFHRMLT
jgi:hypothetical protein